VRVDATLEPGAITETVEVTASRDASDRSLPKVAPQFRHQMVTDLPLANRSFQALAGLVAGVTPPTVTSRRSRSAGHDFFPRNVRELIQQHTCRRVDNTIRRSDSHLFAFGGMVQEVHVTTVLQCGVWTRGRRRVNVATRGGTNQLHGSLWEFHRSTNLRGAEFVFSTPVDRPSRPSSAIRIRRAAGDPSSNKHFSYAAYRERYLRQANYHSPLWSDAG